LRLLVIAPSSEPAWSTSRAVVDHLARNHSVDIESLPPSDEGINDERRLRRRLAQRAQTYERVVFVDARVAHRAGIVDIDNAVLLPLITAASDIRNSPVAEAVSSAGVVICLSPGEAAIAEELKPRLMMIATRPPSRPGTARDRLRSIANRRRLGPVAVALGPAGLANNFDDLIAKWCAFLDRPRTRTRNLVLLGIRTSEVPNRPDILVLRGSTLEAFQRSITSADYLIIHSPTPAQASMAEAWTASKPVLVNQANEAATFDVRSAVGGLTYGTTEEFVHAANEVYRRSDELGQNGYRWMTRSPHTDIDDALAATNGR
jgi:hypothetical protein